jgi:hypothetical protein
MFWRKVDVGTHDRVLVARNGTFRDILTQGHYWFLDAPFAPLELERHDARNLVFQSSWADYLLKNRSDVVERFLLHVKTSRIQVAMIYVNGMLYKVLPPSKRLLLWRGVAEIKTELVDVIVPSARAFDRIRVELEPVEWEEVSDSS